MRETEQIRDPKRYERIKLLVGLVNLAVYVVVPLVVLVSGASASVRDLIAEVTWGMVVLGAVVYIVGASVLLELVTLPLGYFSGHVLEKRYGLTRRTVFGWAKDWLKGLGLQTMMLALFVGCLYALVMLDPGLWWVWASLVFRRFRYFWRRSRRLF